MQTSQGYLNPCQIITSKVFLWAQHPLDLTSKTAVLFEELVHHLVELGANLFDRLLRWPSRAA